MYFMPLSKEILEQFKNDFEEITCLNVQLNEISRWGIGGIAKCLVKPRSVDELQKVILKIKQLNMDFITIGGTSNILFSDEGVDKLIIQIGNEFSSFKLEKGEVTFLSGIWVPKFAKLLANANLSGAEHVIGIPGTLGGLICMNGGSLRKCIGDNVVRVQTIDRNGNIKSYTNNECHFSYRHSIFKNLEEVIISASFKFEHGDSKTIKSKMLQILKSRSKKFPRKEPNCGSVFISNPAMYEEFGPPGLVIDKCNLKGMVYGGAQISPKHSNFIVNTGNASSTDVLFLIKKIKATVLMKTGYNMRSEVLYVNSNGAINPADSV